MKLRLEVEVRPTESREKVERAVRNIFPTVELKPADGRLVGESCEVSAIARLRQLLRVQAILDAARSMMYAGRTGDTVRVMLNKQAAFVGKISFTEGESPLGPIVVELEAPDVERLIDYLAPRTKEGKPVAEISYP